jgi:NAD(P)-dependent dehydrogenase (short-subunit alcohol dehydrogenase family)
VLATDLHGCFYTIKAVIGGMLSRGRGVILTISSIGADRCAPGGAPYHVSKAGLNTLTLTLANEVAARGIRVNAIAPGLLMSDMGERMVKAVGEQLIAGIPLGRAGRPEEIAKLAAFLASDDARGSREDLPHRRWRRGRVTPAEAAGRGRPARLDADHARACAVQADSN